MEQTVFNSEFCIITYDNAKQIVSIEWQEKTRMMDDKGFRATASQMASVVTQHTPTALLINAQKLDFVIAPDIQEWYQENIIPQYTAAGLKKIGIVMTQEFVANLSIEQVFKDKPSPHKLVNNYFSEVDKALDWLLKQ